MQDAAGNRALANYSAFDPKKNHPDALAGGDYRVTRIGKR